MLRPSTMWRRLSTHLATTFGTEFHKSYELSQATELGIQLTAHAALCKARLEAVCKARDRGKSRGQVAKLTSFPRPSVNVSPCPSNAKSLAFSTT